MYDVSVHKKAKQASRESGCWQVRGQDVWGLRYLKVGAYPIHSVVN